MDDIVKQVLAGNKEKFRQIIHDISPTLRIYFATRVYDSSIIEDLCQETFVDIYQNLKKYRLGLSFKNWTLGIAANKLKMHYRSVDTRKKAFEKLQSEVETYVLPEIPEFEQSQSQKEIQSLKKCLEKTSSKIKDIFSKRYFQNLSVLEIAQDYRSTETAISSLLYRSKKNLSNCMKETH